MTRKKFEDIAGQAIAELPEEFRRKLENIAVTIEDYPSDNTLLSLDPKPRKHQLLGIYIGIPYNRRPPYPISGALPERVELYQKNIESICSNESEIRFQIKETIIHEIGHYFGLSEETLERLQKRQNQPQRPKEPKIN